MWPRIWAPANCGGTPPKKLLEYGQQKFKGPLGLELGLPAWALHICSEQLNLVSESIDYSPAHSFMALTFISVLEFLAKETKKKLAVKAYWFIIANTHLDFFINIREWHFTCLFSVIHPLKLYDDTTSYTILHQVQRYYNIFRYFHYFLRVIPEVFCLFVIQSHFGHIQH